MTGVKATLRGNGWGSGWLVLALNEPWPVYFQFHSFIQQKGLDDCILRKMAVAPTYGA